MLAQPPAAAVQFTGLFLCSVEYGIYLVTYGVALRAFLRGGSAAAGRSTFNWGFFTASVVIFALITFKIVLLFQASFRAFVLYRGPGGPAAGIAAGLSPWYKAAVVGSTAVLITIGDLVLIYRCFVTYSYRWTIILGPLFLLTIATGASVAYFVLTVVEKDFINLNSDPGEVSEILTSVSLGFTLLTNSVTTSLIIWKLWRVHRETKRLVSFASRRPSTLTKLVRIMMESGLLYTSFCVLSLLAKVAGDLVSDFAQIMMHIVIGISFNLIVIRIDEARTEGGGSRVATRPTPSVMVSIAMDGVTRVSVERVREADPEGSPGLSHAPSSSTNLSSSEKKTQSSEENVKEYLLEDV